MVGSQAPLAQLAVDLDNLFFAYDFTIASFHKILQETFLMHITPVYP